MCFLRFVFTCAFLASFARATYADDLDDALRATYIACVEIDDEISHLKTMAGINTAVTSVGTAAGVGAVATGFVKMAKDDEIAELENLLQEMQKLSAEYQGDTPTAEQKKSFFAEFNDAYNTAIQDITTAQEHIDTLNKQSKKLGDWRTGLLAGNAATNIAGAVIAGTNKVDKDLETQIQNCVSSVKNLRTSIMQSRINGSDVSEAETIANACAEYEYIDVSKINKRATGAMLSSAVGAAAGVAGTVTSGVANSNNVRDNNTSDGKQHEKNLNTAANVLSVGATAASVTATVFNATQIAAIKKVASVSEKCTGVLK